MKLPTKSICTKKVMTARGDRGSLIIEAMVAISVVTIFVVSTLSLTWSARALGPILEKRFSEIYAIRDTMESWASLPGVFSKWIDDASVAIFPLGATSSISTTIHDERLSFGSSTCEPTAGVKSFSSSPYVFTPATQLPSGILATDIVAKNKFVYLSVDSSTPSDPDLFIYDTSNVILHLPPVSTFNTGPGLNAIAVAGHYLYAANTSIGSQLQIMDILDRSKPVLIGSLKLPLPTSTTSSPVATSIAYFDQKIYLGTEKWNGPEFVIIDVSTPSLPRYLGGLEIGSKIKNIFVRENKAYIANAGDNELVVADVSDPASPSAISSISPLGTQIEEGNRITFHHDKLWYGRAGGGFGNSAYQELMSLSLGGNGGNTNLSISTSTHVVGGVYGIAVIDPYVFFATGDQKLEIWDDVLSTKISSLNISTVPVAMSCDGMDMYIATSDRRGFIRLMF